ncbi:uric acid degradation bifunctional protein TTL-like [Arachis ipaensis]|uniref:uric acid degradation bifunctional protein TTL-like n=1 Tax=Arachis ipaensis TaxID=130454 RepID=UPI000A2AFDEA|nr:uric acid degradation bifunctional protein TTL-like [Arachis ipaensis]
MRLELEQFGRKYRRKFGFVFITSTDKKLSHQILQEVKTRYENPLSVELDITSREEFILIERKLAQLWEHLSRENTRETPKETGEVVQDSMQKENVMKDDSSKRLFLL